MLGCPCASQQLALHKPRPCPACASPCRDSGRLRLCKVSGCTFVNQYLVVKYLGRWVWYCSGTAWEQGTVMLQAHGVWIADMGGSHRCVCGQAEQAASVHSADNAARVSLPGRPASLLQGLLWPRLPVHVNR